MRRRIRTIKNNITGGFCPHHPLSSYFSNMQPNKEEELKKKYGWLADIVASTIILGFKILETYLKMCWNIITLNPYGFLYLIALHLLAILLLLGKGL